ncbi:galactose oxidase/kelch repeat superfamily protein [Wolffia australiana]
MADDYPELAVSLDLLLPDDLLERILSHLPLASLLRAAAVCTRWRAMVRACRLPRAPSPPWYFMFTANLAKSGHTYDPSLRKWYAALDLPCLDSSAWSVSASRGLLCLLDHDTRARLFVCNPITRAWARLAEPPGARACHYSAVALAASARHYTVAAVLSRQEPGDLVRWEVSVHVYRSATGAWTTPAREGSAAWRSGEESVICGGVLYFMAYSEGRHGLMGFDLGEPGSLGRPAIPMPRPLTSGRLMNLRERLVLVGGIGKPDRADVITGIGVWELDRAAWREVARVPHRFYRGFGELDDVFASSGAGDVVYIQSYGSPALLLFDMAARLWRWSHKCPVSKRSSLQLFTGFCFEPRLDVSP